MSENFVYSSTPGEASPPSDKALTFVEVARLLNRLYELGLLNAEIAFPEDWRNKQEFSAEELSTLIRRHLTRTGWQRLLEAFRAHNRQPDVVLWDLSVPADFIAALELVASLDEMLIWKGKRNKHASSIFPPIFGGRWLRGLLGKMGKRSPVLPEHVLETTASSERVSRLSALADEISSLFSQTRAKFQANRALGHVAAYVARSLRDDMEREAFLQRVNRLRNQMQEHLDIFCEEEGIPKPIPYSRDEAIYLHFLSAYFIAIAEAEERLKQRGIQWAQRKISLEEERVRARINNEILPELLTMLQESDPLREELLRERIRHRVALTVGSVITAIFSGLWGGMEAVFEVSIASIERFAPIVAPPLLVGLLTLVAQTVVRGIPFTLKDMLVFLVNALWNTILALGATLIVYGCWRYWSQRTKGSEMAPQKPTIIQTEQNGAQVPLHPA